MAITNPIETLMECHEDILRQLNMFEAVLLDLEQNGINAFVRQRESISETFEFFDTTLVLHIMDEEEGLFPLLEPMLQRRSVPHPHFERTPIQAIEEQHRKAEEAAQRLKILNSKLLSEFDQSRSAILLEEFVKKGKALISFYREHVRGENEAVFPLAQRLLTEEEKAKVASVMNAHRGSVQSNLIC